MSGRFEDELELEDVEPVTDQHWTDLARARPTARDPKKSRKKLNEAEGELETMLVRAGL